VLRRVVALGVSGYVAGLSCSGDIVRIASSNNKGLADVARHVIGCHVSQLADIARHVIGCQLTQLPDVFRYVKGRQLTQHTRVENACR